MLLLLSSLSEVCFDEFNEAIKLVLVQLKRETGIQKVVFSCLIRKTGVRLFPFLTFCELILFIYSTKKKLRALVDHSELGVQIYWQSPV